MNIGRLYSLRVKMQMFVFLLAAVQPLLSQTLPTTSERLVSIASDKNNSDKMRMEAVSRLGELKTDDTSAVSSLIRCFADKNLFLVGKAAQSLSQIGKKAVPYLRKALQEQNEHIRWGSAISLSKIGRDAQEAAPSLVEALNDKNDNVRWCSLVALGNMGEAASGYASQISRYLYDDNEDIRWATVYALSKINYKRITESPDHENVKKNIMSLVPELIKELHVPGVSVCLIEGGKVTWSKSFGVKDARSLEPVSKETMFEACSMTKPIFAYTVLKLAEKKKLDLDKPLAYYLDENFISIIDFRNKITARMILCHTSGFPNWRKGDEETDGPLPLYSEPGTRFGYSGEGYYYLQRVVEKITGEPLDVYVKNNLFGPLRLEHINFVWTKEHDLDIASGHDTSGHFLQKTRYEQPNAAYTLYTSTEDYASFICLILTSRGKQSISLSQATLDEMMKHQVEVFIREPIPRPGRRMGIGVYWGLGWAIDSTITGNIIYHSGANRSGFRCYSQFNYFERTGIVIMTNGLNGSDLWRRLICKIGDF